MKRMLGIGQSRVDPRLFNSFNLIRDIRNATGGARGINWGIPDEDLVRFLQGEPLMTFSRKFPKFVDHFVSTEQRNRCEADRKGMYFHGLEQHDLLLGVEHVYPSTKQPSTWGNMPSGGYIGNSNIMSKAEDGIRGIYRNTTTTIGRVYPKNASYHIGVDFSPSSFINEDTGNGFMCRLKLAHDLDFGSIPSSYNMSFTTLCKIMFSMYVIENIIPGITDINTEFGQYATNYVDVLRKYSDQFETFMETIDRERMYNADRKKLFRT